MTTRLARTTASAVLALGLALAGAGSTPAEATDPPPRPVAVIGDFGSGSEAEQAVADLVSAARPVAVVTTGDNVYDDRGYADLVGSYYGRWITAGRLLPAVGNHDHAVGIGAFDAYFPYLHGRHVYSAGAGGMRFFFLDSTVALDSGTSFARQRGWLRRALTASQARWKVVVLHHPPYSSGSAHGSSPQLRWPFAGWGADLVLSGHEHQYERLDVDGLPYVVDGSGGKDLYPFGDVLPGSVVRFDGEPGALFLSADARALTGEFRSVSGRVIDRFAVAVGARAGLR